MDDSPKHSFKLPPAQQRIREKCLHPSGHLSSFRWQMSRALSQRGLKGSCGDTRITQRSNK